MTGLSLEYSYCQLPSTLYTTITPKPFPSAELVLFNATLAKDLGLTWDESDKNTLTQLLLGAQLPPNAEPIAMAYSGHQFGHFTHLGDGRAFLLGEYMTPNKQRVDFHLKGAGKTIYGREGDGKAVIGPMLREYILSEAMHALRIPTTRSLAVISTGESVYRQGLQPGALLVRVASSHIRFGTFQYAAIQGDAVVKDLLTYTVQRHYPDLFDVDQPLALAFLDRILQQLVNLVVHWEKVGFIHGVMNTDNMAVSGETFDYGPCAFMDNYSPLCVFSSIDNYGRYAFKNQAPIAQWNLTRLAESLLPLIDPNPDKAIDLATQLLNTFPSLYQIKLLQMMRQKLGLLSAQEDDKHLIESLLSIMHQHALDYSDTFFKLTYETTSLVQEINSPLQSWLNTWETRRQIENNDAGHQAMCLANPVVIPRNHRVEYALTRAEREGDLSAVNALLDVVKTPYQLTKKAKLYNTPPLPEERIQATYCGT
jgi:uncharacterized protein YdiU (UPF0061 family)